MKLDTWLLCHVHAYNYFGGATRLLIPDNLKTGVTQNTRYETVLNRSYQELAEHYDTAIVPARVEHPKDKPLAEGTVKFASTWVLAALRDRKFFSVQEAQAAAAEKLEDLNDRPFKKRGGTRRTAYLQEEKEFMKPLPTVPYEPAVWSPELRIGRDYLVSDGLNRYSVPFDLIGEAVVQHFLTVGKEPEQGYKACASMTRLADRYGTKRLEDACERLLSFTSVPTIRTLSTILKNGQDRLAAPETAKSDTKPVQHGITRGAAYFRKGGATE